MPRTRSKAKQTRLSFAPVALPATGEDPAKDKSPRSARVRYNLPSAPLIRPRPSSRQDQSSNSPPANKSTKVKDDEEPLSISSEDEGKIIRWLD